MHFFIKILLYFIDFLGEILLVLLSNLELERFGYLIEMILKSKLFLWLFTLEGWDGLDYWWEFFVKNVRDCSLYLCFDVVEDIVLHGDELSLVLDVGCF